MKPKVRLICYAWGEAYVDRLLSYAVAAALAPGNLSALARSFDCTVVILTEQRLFDYVRAHPIRRQVEALCPLRLLPLDDLVAEPWQYGLTVAYSLFRGITDLAGEGTDTYCLFLNADFVLADGCYETLIPRILAGEHLHLSPSYCVAEERALPNIEAHRDAATGALRIAKRDMARLILKHRHNTILAKTVNQGLFHFRYMDQFYWHVDEATLIGHQMPIAMIGVRPEIIPPSLNTFWDWGMVYELCPSRKLAVLGDSDDFLMLELRADATHLDLIRAGRDTPAAMASRMTGYITQYQVDNAKFPLTLHMTDLPPSIDSDRAKLGVVVAEVLSHLPSKPIDHTNHEQWHYHQSHFELYRRSGIRNMETELVSLVAARQRHATEPGQDLFGVIAGGGDPKKLEALLIRRLLINVLDAEIAARREKLRACRDRFAFKVKLETRIASTNDPSPPAAVSWRRRLFDLIMGRFPNLRIWHPAREAYADLIVRGPAAMGASECCLFVAGHEHADLRRIAGRFGKSHVLVGIEELIKNSAPELLADGTKFDTCAITLIGAERRHFSDAVAATKPLLKDDAKIFVHWINRDSAPREVWEPDLARLIVGRGCRIKVTYLGSRAATQAMAYYHRGRGALERSLARAPIALAGIVLSMAYASFAYYRSARRASGEADTVPPVCASITVELAYEKPRAAFVGAEAPAEGLHRADTLPAAASAPSDVIDRSATAVVPQP